MPHPVRSRFPTGDRSAWRASVGLIARFAFMAVFCGTAAYLTAAAFAPSMGTSGWDPVFALFAAFGILISVVSAAARLFRRGKSGEGELE